MFKQKTKICRVLLHLLHVFSSVPLYLILCFFFSKELSPQPPFYIVYVGKLPALLSHVAALGYNLNDI